MFGPSNNDWNHFFIVCGLLCAVAGWGVIEFLLWIVSNVSIHIGS